MYVMYMNLTCTIVSTRTLFRITNQKRTAVIAKCRKVVSFLLELMFFLLSHTTYCTVRSDHALPVYCVKTALMYGDFAILTSEALFPKSPDKIGTVGAESWLIEKMSNKIMIICFTQAITEHQVSEWD